jgi:predicted solute-binding protein
LEPTPAAVPQVCAVSFLNTTPLVWGITNGPYSAAVDLRFAAPAACADQVAAGMADIGLIPAVELLRLPVERVAEVGIACRGPVRSILLFTRVPWTEIRTLAADENSRTSVQLARWVLRERFGVQPAIRPAAPDPRAMLATADAALVIGDPALRVEPDSFGVDWLDLGREWVHLTGLPMVFAVWAGAPRWKEHAELFRASWEFGRDHMEDVIAVSAPRYGFPVPLVRRYLTEHISYELGPCELDGLRTYLQAVQTLQKSA